MSAPQTYKHSTWIECSDDGGDVEIEIVAEYTFTPGHRATHEEPECGPEIEIVKTTTLSGGAWALNEEEVERIIYEIVEGHDDGPDPDDSRERAFEREKGF